MKSVVTKSLISLCLLFFISLACAPATRAQDVKLQLDNLERLEPRASQSVDVTLDGALLRLAISFLKNDKPKERAIKEMVAGLRGIHVKVLEFEKEGEYTSADVDSVRTQLRSPDWSRMFGVKSRKEGENLEVFTMLSAGKINGMAIIITAPKKLAVINIAGLIDLEKLTQLSGQFGIPSLEINLSDKKPEGVKP